MLERGWTSAGRSPTTPAPNAGDPGLLPGPVPGDVGLRPPGFEPEPAKLPTGRMPGWVVPPKLPTTAPGGFDFDAGGGIATGGRDGVRIDGSAGTDDDVTAARPPAEAPPPAGARDRTLASVDGASAWIAPFRRSGSASAFWLPRNA